MIDIREIKQYAINKMHGSTFAHVIASEADELSDQEFGYKIATWFRILGLESGSETKK